MALPHFFYWREVGFLFWVDIFKFGLVRIVARSIPFGGFERRQ
jgi:hypothetical protein